MAKLNIKNLSFQMQNTKKCWRALNILKNGCNYYLDHPVGPLHSGGGDTPEVEICTT